MSFCCFGMCWFYYFYQLKNYTKLFMGLMYYIMYYYLAVLQ